MYLHVALIIFVYICYGIPLDLFITFVFGNELAVTCEDVSKCPNYFRVVVAMCGRGSKYSIVLLPWILSKDDTYDSEIISLEEKRGKV